MKCDYCGEKVPMGAARCPSCGARARGQTQAEQMVFCKSCGQQVSKAARTCPSCGAETRQSPWARMRTPAEPYTQPQPVPRTPVPGQFTCNDPSHANVQPKSKTTALILCIVLGTLGAHRFYVGKTGTGLLYLFTRGLCYVGWIVDIISIITGKFLDSQGNPLV